MTDPAPHERQYVRNAETGDRGYLIERDGETLVRYDRPLEVIERRYNAGEWVPVHDARPMTVMQASMVAFEADKKLCQLLGDWKASRRDWSKMRDVERIDWANGRWPTKQTHPAREQLYAAIMATMKDYAQ